MTNTTDRLTVKLGRIIGHPGDVRTYTSARARGESVTLAAYRARVERACRETLTDTYAGDSDHDDILAPYSRDLLATYDVDADALARWSTLGTTVRNADGSPVDTTVRLPDGARARIFVYHDSDASSPAGMLADEGGCYSPDDVEAWERDAWTYVGVTAVVVLADGRTGEASLWGTESGDYWPGSDEADIWHVVPDQIAEALADAERTPAGPVLTYWPEEGSPDFVSDDDGATWVPVCEARARMTARRAGPTLMWSCECHDTSHMLWAEDWPNATDDDDEAPRG